MIDGLGVLTNMSDQLRVTRFDEIFHRLSKRSQVSSRRQWYYRERICAYHVGYNGTCREIGRERRELDESSNEMDTCEADLTKKTRLVQPRYAY